ncbi:DUF6503 family protein [Maribacter sp. 2308TA10-17]|uniref:DUF6503 family protein n=1 Tax=Maribacter sp. 2308TA10-17 TaxID=3386276 RepID=UPI0039BD2FF2
MKLVLVSLLCLSIFACKETPKEMKTESEVPEKVAEINDSMHPESLQKIFEAHGGLEAWNSKRTLSFEIPKPENTEKHTIDLRSRDEKIEMPNTSMGSDGETIWLLEEKGAYKGDAVFYHNLMFYFYAMPFVLADDGINYSEVEALEFEGKTYPGIRISYNDGVGISPKDEYFIHYNPDTYQMEWLGYTVTFRSGEKSDNIKWIRYNDWMNIGGLVLPKSLTWHEYEGRTIKAAREPLQFENVTLSESPMEVDFFLKPEKAKIVNGKTE